MGRLTPVSWCAAAGLVLAVAAVAAFPTAPPRPVEFECRFLQGPITDPFLPKRGQVKFHRGVRDDEFHVEAKVRLDGTLNKRDDTDRGWTVEGRIPWYDFLRTGGRPDLGERWKFALCRYDYRID